jgi:hypothetical protein
LNEQFSRTLFEIMPRYRVDAGVAAALDELVGNGPAVVVCRYFWPYCKTGLHWRRKAGIRTMIDVDDRDDLAPLLLGRAVLQWLQSFSPIDRGLRLYIRWLLRAMLRKANHVWFVRADDAAEFADAPVSLAPNAPFAAAAHTPPPSAAGENVLFVGSAAHASNVSGVRWFLKRCWPKIRAARPAATFRLVGSGGWREQLSDFVHVDGAEIVGFVNDLASEYAASRVVVSPVFEGGGTKIKVVEACGFGRPVVATVHSCSGFGDELETAVPTANDADEFVIETLRFLDDPAAADTIGATLKLLQGRLLTRSALEAAIVRDAVRVSQLGDARQ